MATTLNGWTANTVSSRIPARKTVPGYGEGPSTLDEFFRPKERERAQQMSFSAATAPLVDPAAAANAAAAKAADDAAYAAAKLASENAANAKAAADAAAAWAAANPLDAAAQTAAQVAAKSAAEAAAAVALAPKPFVPSATQMIQPGFQTDPFAAGGIQADIWNRIFRGVGPVAQENPATLAARKAAADKLLLDKAAADRYAADKAVLDAKAARDAAAAAARGKDKNFLQKNIGWVDPAAGWLANLF